MTASTTWLSRRHLIRLGIAATVGLSATGLLTETLVAARSDLFPPGSDAMVTAGRLNLRSGPGLAHEVIGSIAQGAVATTLSDVVRADDHYWYSIDAGQVGWAAGTWLALNDSAASQGLRLQVVDGPLNLRDAPLLAEAVITALPAGATLRVTQADGGTWAVGCHWTAVQVEAPHPIEGCVADGSAAPIWRASGAQDETGRSLERPARFHFILQGKQNAKGSYPKAVERILLLYTGIRTLCTIIIWERCLIVNTLLTTNSNAFGRSSPREEPPTTGPARTGPDRTVATLGSEQMF